MRERGASDAKSLYDEEIDLREYVRAVFNRWYILIALGFLASLAALGASYVLPQTYEATATVLFTKSPSQNPSDFASTLKLLPPLATSDEVLSQVIAKVSSKGADLSPDLQSIGRLRAALAITPNTENGLVSLRARAGDPAQAAAIANEWASILVSSAPRMSTASQGDLASLEARLADADTQLSKAESALAESRASGNLAAIEARLSSLQEARKSYQNESYIANRLLDDIAGFRGRIAAYPPGAQVSVADALVATLLQARVFSVGAGTSGAALSPLQVPVSVSDTASTQKASDVLLLLDGLTDKLQARSKALDALIEKNTSQISEVQIQKDQEQSRATMLVAQRDAAKEIYRGLATKVNEARISGASSRATVAITSQASLPANAAGPSRWRNAAIAGGLGLFTGVVAVLVLIWWRQDARIPIPSSAVE